MIKRLKQREPLFNLAAYLIVAGMLACMAASLVQLGQAFVGGWQGAYLVGYSFLVALESMYSRRAIQGRNFGEPDWLLYRLTEWVVLMVGLKLAYYVQAGAGALIHDLPLWISDFGVYFFSSEYGIGLLIIVLVWGLAWYIAGELEILEIDENVVRAEIESRIYAPRAEARQRLVNTMLTPGLLMVFLTALLRSDIGARWSSQAEMRAGVVNLLSYFLLFLVFLSLTQFSVLRAEWMHEGLPIRGEVIRRWLAYSFMLILILAVISGFLPTGYSVGPLAILNYLFFLVAVIINIIGVLLVTPFLLLMSWLMGLFGSQAEKSSPPMTVPQVPLPPETHHAPLPWLELLKAILFWSILLGLAIFSLVYYLRERRDLVSGLRRLPFYNLLAQWWAWLKGLMGGAKRQILASVEAGMERIRMVALRRPKQAPWNYLNLRRLSPRQRVIFYYLAMVRRGGESGLARRAAQTPYEYSHSLRQYLNQVPAPTEVSDTDEGRTGEQVSEDIRALTERFVEARYSLHPVSQSEASFVQRCWERIRSVLRRA
jgi:hypothetical protein